MKRSYTLSSWVLVLLMSSGCGAMDLGMKSADTGAMGESTAGDFGGSAGGGGGQSQPEVEEELLALPPAQTDVYVFVANPERDTVTRVNVLTNEVKTRGVGAFPTVVATTPDYSTAVVFNQAGDSVTVIDALTLDAFEVPVRDNYNQMKLSPQGGWATLWHDALEDDDGEPNGIQSFNEASFVHVETGAHFPMAVGFNPHNVVFTGDDRLALVVSDAFLALVDLTEDTPTPELISLSDELDPPKAEEVIVAPAGDWAFVRQFGTDEILVVDLVAGVVDAIGVGENPTDLDLSPDGTEAVAVARSSAELWVLDAINPFNAPKVVPIPPELSAGSLQFDPTGDQAVLFTTASAVDQYGIWDRATDTITQRSLVKPVSGVAITPTGESLLVFHPSTDAPGSSTSNNPFHGHFALTMISLLDPNLANPLRLDAEPIGYGNSASGDRGFFIMDGVKSLVELDYRTLLHENIQLSSVPVYVGVLPDLTPGDDTEPKAWASQQHDLGRISFYDPNQGSLETITGFELNSQIEEGP
jgi:DNA-binding beta-propeller fold protein YncE